MPWKGLSDPERFTDYTWSAAGLKCGSGMRRPSRYRVGGKSAGCFGSREASVGVCGRHEGSARKWCWKRRWEMPRQGRACYAALGLEPIPWATGSQFLVLCHQLHAQDTAASSRPSLYFRLPPLKAGWEEMWPNKVSHHRDNFNTASLKKKNDT